MHTARSSKVFQAYFHKKQKQITSFSCFKKSAKKKGYRN